MEKTTDIAILGDGLAAYAAALELKDSGCEVTIVSKAPGATALSSGAWDIAESPTRSAQDDWEKLPTIRENLSEILRRNEFHPYSVFSKGFSLPDYLKFIEEHVGRAIKELPLSMEGSVKKNQVVLNNLGTVKSTAWVQSSMIDADLRRWKEAKVLVVGIHGFSGFNSRFIRHRLLELQEGQSKQHIGFVGSFDVELPNFSHQASLTAIELAQRLDQKETFVKFGHEIVKYIDGKIYSHLLLPSILGIENTMAITEALKKITGLATAETLATPMSVPGYRLHRALQKFYQQQGLNLVTGEVSGFEGESRQVKKITIQDAEKSTQLRAKAFLLATGKYIGGGIKRERVFQESVFQLPVSVQHKQLAHQSPARFTDLNSAHSQPFLQAGIRINSFGQPLDTEGEVIFDNLFAAGSILADFDPSHERSAAGVSLISGTLAARHAKGLA